jgi:hypothetical protein
VPIIRHFGFRITLSRGARLAHLSLTDIISRTGFPRVVLAKHKKIALGSIENGFDIGNNGADTNVIFLNLFSGRDFASTVFTDDIVFSIRSLDHTRSIGNCLSVYLTGNGGKGAERTKK